MLLLFNTPWREAVMNVARRNQQWLEPRWATGLCIDASQILQEELEQCGVAASLYAGYQPKTLLPTDFVEHVFIVTMNDLAVDLTGRQFWPACDFPIIEPLHEYRTRYLGEVGPYAG